MRRAVRWMTPLCLLVSASALMVRPAAASTTGCWETVCLSCTCSLLTGLCECTKCFTWCILF